MLDSTCADPSLSDRPQLTEGAEGYRKHRNHPMNRYPDHVRDRIENHLDMVLRADPAGSSGLIVCRVYSPEVNTQEKLRKLIERHLGADDGVDVVLSDSTLKRMMDSYLKARGFCLRFTQSDYNACPNCKGMHYAVLQFHHEWKELNKEAEELLRLPRSVTQALSAKVENIVAQVDTKLYQENASLEELKSHNEHDACIRKFIKVLSNHFRGTENAYRRLETSEHSWDSFPDHACVTHQDYMTKVDLPHFVITASSDITRWRFNAHVSSVTEDSVIFSHEQGTGPKNSSSIVEQVILDHLVRFKGESITVVVSDNAAVGKNWLTTVALPHYLVDQGLAEVVLIVFLENNHGKWLADMFFGQLQTRRWRSTLLGVDDLLQEFERVNRSNGTVRGVVYGTATGPGTRGRTRTQAEET